MSQVLEPQSSPHDSPVALPPLENGDHLDQQTFHERYEAMPEGFRAELIQGRVHTREARVSRSHGHLHSLITGWLGRYEMNTQSVDALTGATVILDEWNEAQPDNFLAIKPEFGGQTTVNEDDYFKGPPELAIEVAASTEAVDLYEKRDAYEQAGVQEYVIVVMRTAEIRWLKRDAESKTFVDHPAGDDGVFRSSVFPGLWLNAKALFTEDGPQLMKTLQDGLASPEHQAFAEELSRRAL